MDHKSINMRHENQTRVIYNTIYIFIYFKYRINYRFYCSNSFSSVDFYYFQHNWFLLFSHAILWRFTIFQNTSHLIPRNRHVCGNEKVALSTHWTDVSEIIDDISFFFLFFQPCPAFESAAFMIDGRRNFSRVYGFRNLVYVCDRSGAGDSQDFCVSAKARRRGRSLHTQKEREDDERRFALRTVTNGSAGPSSRVPNVSRAVTIGWMSAHICAGTSYFEFFCRFFRVIWPDLANDPRRAGLIFRDHYARYLLSPIVRK